ncbi:MAG: hypothetical protein ACLR5T_00360 [Veillonella sp.]
MSVLCEDDVIYEQAVEKCNKLKQAGEKCNLTVIHNQMRKKSLLIYDDNVVDIRKKKNSIKMINKHTFGGSLNMISLMILALSDYRAT